MPAKVQLPLFKPLFARTTNGPPESPLKMYKY